MTECLIINNFINNDTIQIFLTLFLGMFAGLTLRPIPQIIDDVFSNNFFIKLTILVLLGIRIFFPINYSKLIIIITIASILLISLDFLRKYECKKKINHK